MSGFTAPSTTAVDDRNEWRTPEALVNYCRDLMGGIDFDTACTLDNAVAKPVWWHTHPDMRRDAFAVQWTGRCFCNPPYDNITPWIKKALASNATTAMVLPSPNGEARYFDLMVRSTEVHIVGRVSFIGTDGKPKNGNPRGTSIFVVQPTMDRWFPNRRVVRRSDLPGPLDRPAPVWRP